MNYIKSLQNENAAAERELQAMRDSLTEFRAYLASDKFRTDPTVQVQDVFNRLANVEKAATDARDAS